MIRRWAEGREAQPATATRSGPGARAGDLRFIFPGYGGARLQPMGWDEWLGLFDERNLVLLLQEHLKTGEQSNFFQIDRPERE
ncbi:MAG: hypothetical protein GEU80_09780 [Dehalococcoidia bacterium]|nr:hypothetical protein [Dehalococcoidia bacterium]